MLGPCCSHSDSCRLGRQETSFARHIALHTACPVGAGRPVAWFAVAWEWHGKCALRCKELQLGLTYVALSRVRTLSGLLLRGCYGADRIMRLNAHRKHQARQDAESWLDSLGESA